MNIVEKAEVLSHQLARLRGEGYEISVTHDLQRVLGIVASLGKPYLTPLLDPQKNDFTSSNCMWLIVERSGRPVALGGVRLDEIGDDDAEEFLNRTYSRHYPGGLSRIAEPLKEILKGRVCYVGDLFVDPKERGRLFLLEAGMKACQLIISLRWDPDVTYAFLHSRDTMRGAVNRYGFQTAIPFSKIFARPTGPRRNDEVFAALNRDQLNHWVKSESRNSELLVYLPDQKPKEEAADIQLRQVSSSGRA